MDNEEEVIIDSNNEEAEEVATDNSPEETKEEKSYETPEAKKARLERQLNQLGKKHPELFGETETTKPSKKSDGFDYGVKAYLKTEGIDASEFDFVEKEFKNSGLKNVESLLANPYFKSQLDERRALDKTKNATLKGKSPNGIATDSVEYWLTQDFKDVPANLKSKVIEAKLAKENQKNVFYNSK